MFEYFCNLIKYKPFLKHCLFMYQRQVSFGEAISRAMKKYCCFKGRASRSEFWWFILFLYIVQFAAFMRNLWLEHLGSRRRPHGSEWSWCHEQSHIALRSSLGNKPRILSSCIRPPVPPPSRCRTFGLLLASGPHTGGRRNHIAGLHPVHQQVWRRAQCGRGQLPSWISGISAHSGILIQAIVAKWLETLKKCLRNLQDIPH